ncbi:hypothetical protein ACG83_10970 [Frankia sp. R43]|uniref:hypothetical protein n=1 Tax=Frankia sp. R43 TaxID=269536 RepID=UPI0006CA2EC6|nr:hypothetical protein [Frankia sp. R43]KPM55787.1 hypothetical protein ACG83_10970 [Frankia sp. R43]
MFTEDSPAHEPMRPQGKPRRMRRVGQHTRPRTVAEPLAAPTTLAARQVLALTAAGIIRVPQELL